MKCQIDILKEIVYINESYKNIFPVVPITAICIQICDFMLLFFFFILVKKLLNFNNNFCLKMRT